MIIDKERRFSFIHNPRTGGTSFRETFKHFHDKDLDPLLGEQYKKRSIHRKLVGKSFRHVNPYKERSFDKIFERSKYTFTFVRNPFDRAVSYYYKMKPFIKTHSNEEVTFSYFVLQMHQAYVNKSQIGLWEIEYDYWTECVDEVYKFVNLSENQVWSDLINKCGLELVERPCLNKVQRVYQDYREYYSPFHVEIVASIFEKDIKKYNYEF